MKTFVKLFCVASFAALFISSIVISSSTPAEAAGGAGESSRSLYVSNCARCHGGDGRGDTELGRLNDAPDISGGKARRLGSARVTRLISKGAGSMPGFGKKLTKKQIASIVAYTNGL